MKAETRTRLGAGLELRQLSYFVLACQNSTLSDTARDLGISVSSLSAALHALEQTLQLTLFERSGRYLSPLPAAFWLFQHAMPLLHAESRFTSVLAAGEPPNHRVRVHLALDFTMGRFSRAISKTVEALQRDDPLTAYEFAFLSDHAPQMSDHAGQEASGVTDIRIGYFGTGAGTIPLMEDRWIVFGRNDAGLKTPDPMQRLIVVQMQQGLHEAVSAYAYRHGISNRLTLVDEAAIDLSELPARMPGAVFLLPQSMLGERLGHDHRQVAPLDPPLVSRISARVSGSAKPQAQQFLDRLTAELDGAPNNVSFAPQVTARQIQYFNATVQAGGISAAARKLRVTQPTISAQLHKLEDTLDHRLFDRGPGGLDTTESGRLLAPLARDLEARLAAILSNRRGIAASTQSAVAIGILPSSGHDSAMTDLAARAVTQLRQSHPDVQLRLTEGTNAALHEAVRVGELNLAVVGAVSGAFPRVRLGPSEPLSVVANPELGLGGLAEIALTEACSLPLVLGPKFLSIHAVFAEAAAERRLAVNRVIEAGSLPLAISLVRQSPLCTILPASSVRHDVARGRLTATPIVEGISTGNLAMIFSGERELSEIERAVVRLFTAAFTDKP